MPGPFLCVYGHTNLDYIMSLGHFPELNTSVNIEEKKRYFGGTGANVATMAASLGVPTALCSYVGPDFPPEFRELMSNKGVDLSDLVVVRDQETPTVWIISDQEHNQIAYVYQGPMGSMDRMPVQLEKAKTAQWVHIMTGRPDYYLKVMEECRKAERSISFDPAQEIHHVWDAPRFEQAIAMSKAFFCNENELRTALRYLKLEKPEQLLEKVELVVSTQGKKGSLLYTREGVVRVPSVPGCKVVDTTGAGDAFRAGFYAGLYRSRDLVDCATYGSAAASFVIEARGSLTNIPSWDDVLQRVERIC